MKLQNIITIYDYNYWATEKILTAAANLSEEQLNASHGVFGSLRRVLVHIVDTEYSWRVLCQTNVITSDLNEADFPTLADIRYRWEEDQRAMREYLNSLRDDDLIGILRYVLPGGIERQRILWHALYHVVNHSTQHRSEAAALLTEYGHSPNDLDFTMFLNERFNPHS